ncbi:MAG: LamG-like jellyroll fold domain-containing protein [Planctomycetota bacterium]
MKAWMPLVAALLVCAGAYAATPPEGASLELVPGKRRYVGLDSPALQITGSPLSVQAWFKTEAEAGIIFECGASNRDPSPQAGYALYLKWGRVRFGVNNSVEMWKPELWDDATSAATYNDGKWHQATGVFYADGETRVKLYMDGVEDTNLKRAGRAQPALVGYTQTKPVARIMGQADQVRYPRVDDCFWTGSVDEIRVWRKALTAEEIKTNYDKAIDPKTPGLVAYWKFDEGHYEVGDAVRDEVAGLTATVRQYEYVPAIDDAFFPVDPLVFPTDDFNYSEYPALITGYNGQDRQRIAFLTWRKAERRRVGMRGNYKAGMALLGDGTLMLAACRYSADEKGTPGKTLWTIHVYESTDQGNSWSEVNETTLFGKEPALAALPDGTLFLTGQEMGSRPGFKAGEMNAFRSQDRGRTWDRVFIDGGDSPYPYPRNIIVDGGQSLLYLRTRDSKDIETCRSADGGKTWSFTMGKVAWTEKDLEDLKCFAEIGVVRSRDGRLIAALRREIPRTMGEGFEDTWLAESGDDGGSWSTPWRISGTAEVHMYLTELADGRLVATRSDYHLPWGVSAMTSEDGGRTWDREHPIQVALSASCYVGWPVTLQLADGSLVTAYATTIYGEKDEPRSACEVVRWRLP